MCECSFLLKLSKVEGKTHGANAPRRMRYASPTTDHVTMGLPGGPGYLEHPKMMNRPQTRKLTTDIVTENSTGVNSSRAVDFPLPQRAASETIVLRKCMQI